MRVRDLLLVLYGVMMFAILADIALKAKASVTPEPDYVIEWVWTVEV